MYSKKLSYWGSGPVRVQTVEGLRDSETGLIGLRIRICGRCFAA